MADVAVINYARLADALRTEALRKTEDTGGDHLWNAAAVVDQVPSLKSLIAYQRGQVASRNGAICRFQRTVARQEHHIARADTDRSRLRRALNDLLNDCINFDGGKLTDRVLADATSALTETDPRVANAATRRVCELPNGAHFAFPDRPDETWVLLENFGCGECTHWKGLDAGNDRQSICSVAETEEEFRHMTVLVRTPNAQE